MFMGVVSECRSMNLNTPGEDESMVVYHCLQWVDATDGIYSLKWSPKHFCRRQGIEHGTP